MFFEFTTICQTLKHFPAVIIVFNCLALIDLNMFCFSSRPTFFCINLKNWNAICCHSLASEDRRTFYFFLLRMPCLVSPTVTATWTRSPRRRRRRQNRRRCRHRNPRCRQPLWSPTSIWRRLLPPRPRRTRLKNVNLIGLKSWAGNRLTEKVDCSRKPNPNLFFRVVQQPLQHRRQQQQQ